MDKNKIMQTGEVIFSLIETRCGSDAAFERDFNLPPKTVNNWRRGRSSSFMKMLPELADFFEVSTAELLCDADARLSPDERELLALYRSADALSPEEREALTETLRNTIGLYLATRRDGSEEK